MGGRKWARDKESEDVRVVFRTEKGLTEAVEAGENS
jgi:hypothetical protein